MASGDAGAALALYTGHFLEGFHASENAQELDEWIAGERARLRALAHAGARSLAEAARRAERGAEEEQWVRRAYALAGHDELELSMLLRLLDTKGERAGALRLYDDFARRIKLEIDAEPSPETQALVKAIRARTRSPAGAGPATPIDLAPAGEMRLVATRRHDPPGSARHAASRTAHRPDRRGDLGAARARARRGGRRAARRRRRSIRDAWRSRGSSTRQVTRRSIRSANSRRIASSAGWRKRNCSPSSTPGMRRGRWRARRRSCALVRSPPVP